MAELIHQAPPLTTMRIRGELVTVRRLLALPVPRAAMPPDEFNREYSFYNRVHSSFALVFYLIHKASSAS